MSHQLVSQVLTVFSAVMLVYTVLLDSIYMAFSVIAFFTLRQRGRRWTPRELESVMRSPATPGISLIVPAHNEEATIAQSVRALLLLQYPLFEVVVVNDGSKDGTIDALVTAFEMLPAPASQAPALESQPVRGFYRSLAHPNLIAVDKHNGGKADAINAGINMATHPLVCVIDADSLLEPEALARVALPFIEDPQTVAAGGIIRIANGCSIEHGQVRDVRMPTSPLAAFQVVEYLRGFLAGRVALSAANALLVISGAFGAFRRDALLAVGGFRVDTVGEDMEIVVRLHRWCRDSNRPYRIVFLADPVCWTEAPDSLRILASQRRRWQRGTLQVMSIHRGMVGNLRYGVVGLVALPYYLIFEAWGPLIEAGGIVITMMAAAAGFIDWSLAGLLLLASLAYGAIVTVTVVLIEEALFSRYRHAADLLLICFYGMIEGIVYRPFSAWWRLRGSVDYFLKTSGWGTMTRKGFAAPAKG